MDLVFVEMKEEMNHRSKKFSLDMKEAFTNFQISTELEQTKRMR